MSEWDGKERRSMKFCPEHDARVKRTEEVHKAIFGNGDVTKGLYWMVEQNTQFIRSVRQHYWVVIPIAMAGAIAAIVDFVTRLYKHIGG